MMTIGKRHFDRGGAGLQGVLSGLSLVLAAMVLFVALGTGAARAQSYSFSSIAVEGNERIEPATIAKYAGIVRGQSMSQAALNDAYQRVVNSGLFEEVELIPQGGRLLIRVRERPTINTISFEGNKKLTDENLAGLIKSQSRHIYSPAQVEADAAAIAEAYGGSGRYAATVTPRIIRRDGNRVDLAFEIAEGAVTEVERITFVGNRDFSDRRLRQVLASKQAGLLRTFIQSDTYVADRIEFDKQLLRDFYLARGYVDFTVLGVATDFAQERDGFFVTFNIREGQSFNFGQISLASEVDGVDAADFEKYLKVKSGSTYSPTVVDANIARLETVAEKRGLNFVRVDPRITRNDRDLTLDIAFTLVRGPRVFVERIDIEGNTTTLDQVVRRQFTSVEGDPMNPRAIRASAERIRALGFFSDAQVNTRQGSGEDQVIVDVDVVEQPTGNLSFGASYGVATGVGLTLGFSEANFLGRGQYLAVDYSSASSNANASITFIEPAFLDRDLKLKFSAYYNTTDSDEYADYDTRRVGISPALEFPVSELGRLEVRYRISKDTLFNVDRGDATATPPDNGSSVILQREEGGLWTSSLGYTYSYDSRKSGLNPNSGLLLRFSQDYAGLGGDTKYVTTTGFAMAQTTVWNEDVSIRAILDAGGIKPLSGTSSRLAERYFLAGKIRGFEPNGIGPRDLTATNQDALGGKLYAVAKFEADFPLGLPEEYGMKGGLFLDVGSVWSLDDIAGTSGPVDDSLRLRSVIGFSLFWDTSLGPLRFNFSKALKKETYDREQSFDLTISTTF